MRQKRKKRIIVFEIRITVFTDYMQEFLCKSLRAILQSMQIHEESQGRITKFEVKERILDGKTFAEKK